MWRIRECWRGLALLAALALSACGTSSGLPARQFIGRDVAEAYLPLQGSANILLEGYAASVVIAPGIAVTDAHNANIIDSDEVIGTSTDYDLLFFRTMHGEPIGWVEPYVGEKVITYGQGIDGDLRMAEGIVRWTDAPVLARCDTCPIQHPFAFEAHGGKGFSGGPVVDEASGRLVGIVFGFRDGLDDKSPEHRLMYAYGREQVLGELDRLSKPPASTRAAQGLKRRPL